MKIIYHCFGGSHSSVAAAAIHLGLIPKGEIPNDAELMKIPYFDKTNNDDFGSIRFMGVDEWGNEIYVLGKKSTGGRYTQIINGIAQLMGEPQEVMAIDTMPKVNLMMKVGGFLSRRIGLVAIGRPMVGIGLRAAFLNLVSLVEVTRLKLK